MSQKKASKAASPLSLSKEELAAHFWKALKGGDYRELEGLLFSTSTSDSGEVSLKRLPHATELANSRNTKHQSPLTFAADNGLDEHIALLVRAGAKVNDPDGSKEKRCPVHSACWGEEDIILQNLLRCGADLSATDGEGRTVFHIVARMSSRMLFGYLLEISDTPIAEGPLVEGCVVNSIDALKLLAVQDHSGANALHYALGELAGGDHALDVANRLIVFLEDMSKKSALSAEKVKEIVNAPTKSKCTPLHLLAASGVSSAASASLATRIMQLGAVATSRDEQGLTSLHFAATIAGTNADLFKAFALAMPEEIRGAVGIPEDIGEERTALELAVCIGNKGVVEVAAKMMKELKGLVPDSRKGLLLQFAAAGGNKQVQQLLVSGGLYSQDDMLNAVNKAEEAQVASGDEEVEEAEEVGDYSGHGSTAFAGSRVQQARKAAHQRRKETPEERSTRESTRKQVKDAIDSATSKKEAEEVKGKSQLSVGAKLLIAFMFLSMILPLLDYLLGGRRGK